MASAALVALENDRFLANPAREKPVSQFGITMTLDGRQGVLLANFTPHNDKLELEALAFREERFFEAEAGNIEMVVLDRARHLSEIKPHQPTVGADALNALQLKQATAGDPAAEAKALEKDIKRFQNQTMHRQMASKLAKTHIKEGRYNSRLTALPAAHATVLGARVKKLVATPFQQAFGQQENARPAPPPAPLKPSAVPPGQQYQFSKQEFANFYEEHWLPVRENTQEAAQSDTAPSASASRPGSAAGTPDSPGVTPPNALSRRYGQFISPPMQHELQQQIETGSSSSSSVSDTSPQNRRYGTTFDEQFISQLRDKLNSSPSRQEE